MWGHGSEVTVLKLLVAGNPVTPRLLYQMSPTNIFSWFVKVLGLHRLLKAEFLPLQEMKSDREKGRWGGHRDLGRITFNAG